MSLCFARKPRVGLRCVRRSARSGLWLVAALASTAGALADPGEWVRYPSRGLEVQAQLLSPGLDPGPGVLLLHQCDREPGQPNRLRPLARRLAARGLHVLLPDLRGYGGSVAPGRAQDAKGSHLEDARAGRRYLGELERTAGRPLAVLGASCSGRSVAGLLAEPGGVNAVVLLSAALGDRHLEALRRFAGPMLCVAASDDPYGASYRSTRQACLESTNGRSASLLLQASEHGAPLLTAHPELETQVVDWLVQVLGETRAGAPSRAVPRVDQLP